MNEIHRELGVLLASKLAKVENSTRMNRLSAIKVMIDCSGSMGINVDFLLDKMGITSEERRVQKLQEVRRAKVKEIFGE